MILDTQPNGQLLRGVGALIRHPDTESTTEARNSRAENVVAIDTLGPAAGQRSPGAGNRSGSVDRNLTEGSIPQNLFILAWPQVVAGVLQTVDQLADLV